MEDRGCWFCYNLFSYNKFKLVGGIWSTPPPQQCYRGGWVCENIGSEILVTSLGLYGPNIFLYMKRL
jgi:hypothetical protein